MKTINFAAKVEHFATLASRAAYNAATACNAADRDAWQERADRYDAQADAYRSAARIAA